jgi:hypothetical protein
MTLSVNEDGVWDILPPAGQEMICPYPALLGIDLWLCMGKPMKIKRPSL